MEFINLILDRRYDFAFILFAFSMFCLFIKLVFFPVKFHLIISGLIRILFKEVGLLLRLIFKSEVTVGGVNMLGIIFVFFLSFIIMVFSYKGILFSIINPIIGTSLSEGYTKSIELILALITLSIFALYSATVVYKNNSLKK